MKKNIQCTGDFAARFNQYFSQKNYAIHSNYTGRIKGDRFCIYKCGNVIVKNTFCTVLRGTYDNDRVTYWYGKKVSGWIATAIYDIGFLIVLVAILWHCINSKESFYNYGLYMIPFGIWFVLSNALMFVLPGSARASLYKQLKSICGEQEGLDELIENVMG
ncbi:MAG: hypothetical protein K5857_11005 [Lachnospiraceae bacterium]|nr:hypothetical protein [Lachnospiraceae bacterium]